MKRCPWARNLLAVRYDDEEWGVPVHDDPALSEFLILEGAQAGLGWEPVLKKRENDRAAFDNFGAARIARYDRRKAGRPLVDPGITRNRPKITAAIRNAKAFLVVQDEFGSFDSYLWRFVGGRPRENSWRGHGQIPARTRISDTMSRDLKRRGFKFVDSTVCYAFMQATGTLNDHLVVCFRHAQLR